SLTVVDLVLVFDHEPRRTSKLGHDDAYPSRMLLASPI
ncbi:MAG: hypothetical protein QOI34_958, partial [Verrucomicrobiota bacterium]